MWTRVYSCCTQCLFCCFNLAVMIVSAVFRFNTKGSLAAISLTPIYPEGSVESDRTYVDDGQLILGIWIFSIFFVFIHCCGVCYVSAPPTKE